MAFHPKTDKQIKKTNQELEQYLRIYINHRQSNWSEQLATTEFVFNNKVYMTTKSSLFKVNYGKKLMIGFKIRKKEKHVKAEEFVKEIKEMYREVKVILKNHQRK